MSYSNNLSKGSWLVVVEEGCTSTYKIDPDFPELDAALHYVKEAMVKEMHEASKMRPHSVNMSIKERKAWATYEKIMGKDKPSYFKFASLYDIAQAGCQVIKKEAMNNKKKYRAKPKREVNSIMDLEL